MDELFKKILQKPTLFKDERFFSKNHPVKILHRESELSLLTVLYSNLITNPGTYSVNQFIIGESGIGKTATIKYFCNNLVKHAKRRGIDIKYIHINCRKEQLGYRILKK